MKKKSSQNNSSVVESFLHALKHPIQKEACEIRKIAPDCLEGVTEQIKWKAPSFICGGEYGGYVFPA